MTCWLFTLTEENWLTVKSTNIFGIPEKARGRRATELVKPGDVMVFYVSKKRSRSLGGMIVGVYRVVSTWFREDRALWPDEVREGVVKYPWRVRVEPVRLGVVSYRELSGKLSFVGNKERPHVYVMGTPANFRRPIPECDFRVILESLR